MQKNERMDDVVMDEYGSHETIQYAEPICDRPRLNNLHRLKAKKRAIKILKK